MQSSKCLSSFCAVGNFSDNGPCKRQCWSIWLAAVSSRSGSKLQTTFWYGRQAHRTKCVALPLTFWSIADADIDEARGRSDRLQSDRLRKQRTGPSQELGRCGNVGCILASVDGRHVYILHHRLRNPGRSILQTASTIHRSQEGVDSLRCRASLLSDTGLALSISTVVPWNAQHTFTRWKIVTLRRPHALLALQKIQTLLHALT